MSKSGGKGALKPFEPDHGWRKFGTVYEFPVDAVTNYCNFGGGGLKNNTQSLPTLGANCTGLLSGVSRPALPPEAGVRIGPSSWP